MPDYKQQRLFTVLVHQARPIHCNEVAHQAPHVFLGGFFFTSAFWDKNACTVVSVWRLETSVETMETVSLLFAKKKQQQKTSLAQQYCKLAIEAMDIVIRNNHNVTST